jgi:NTE family protein
VATRIERKRINLALQGGGALGAYTWGVLDRVLEDDRLEIDAVSGASAGAMNGVVLCEGIAEGGEVAARVALRKFWEGIAKAGEYSPFRRTPLQMMMRQAMGDTASNWFMAPFEAWMAAWATMASPYQQLETVSPIKGVLESLVDFNLVRKCTQVRLFVAATNVETGRARIFTNAEITADVVMASACLPQMFRAVEIDGEHYWDGGYMGNPPLFPLFENSTSRDIMIVQINPIERPGAPHDSNSIARRINEITFNASLLRELHAIDFVTRLLDENRLDADRYRRMLIHVIADDAALVPLASGAKLNTDMAFLEDLFQIGRLACDRWLDAHYDDLGARSTVDVRHMFRGEVGPIGAAPAGRRRPPR